MLGLLPGSADLGPVHGVHPVRYNGIDTCTPHLVGSRRGESLEWTDINICSSVPAVAALEAQKHTCGRSDSLEHLSSSMHAC